MFPGFKKSFFTYAFYPKRQREILLYMCSDNTKLLSLLPLCLSILLSLFY